MERNFRTDAHKPEEGAKAGMCETLHLLKSPENARRLYAAISQLDSDNTHDDNKNDVLTALQTERRS
jgi:hypothetical protein